MGVIEGVRDGKGVRVGKLVRVGINVREGVNVIVGVSVTVLERSGVNVRVGFLVLVALGSGGDCVDVIVWVGSSGVNDWVMVALGVGEGKRGTSLSVGLNC